MHVRLYVYRHLVLFECMCYIRVLSLIVAAVIIAGESAEVAATLIEVIEVTILVVVVVVVILD